MKHSSSQISDSFILYLEEQGLYSELPTIISKLQAELDRRQEITVISAEKLSVDDATIVSEQAQKAWGEHTISFHVDPLLVTGIIVRFRNQLLDLSGRGRLTDLQAYLT